MNIFFKDIKNNLIITWGTLISDINNTSSYNPYCISSDYYTIFKHIILSILLNEEIILLDSDFTEFELTKLTGYSNYKNFTKSINNNTAHILTNKKELINKLFNPSENWRITLFTSGTTGIPKKISHNFKSITKFVKISKFNKTNIWGFAYNPTHMAGVQVFFQALLNGNSIIRLFGLNTKDIYKEIDINKITHISATPTFYRLLLPYNGSFQSVNRITSGGEKFNEQTFDQIIKIFPNAKITNVYASTEAGSLFASQNDIFSLSDEYKHLIKIENNELLIHNSLIGSSKIQVSEWYNSGDIVEIISQIPLKFRIVMRKNNTINVGGYKVNPIEIEEVILSLTGITAARVYSKPNSVIGNIICCEVITNNEKITETEIRKFLQSKIQEHKIPRIIQFVYNLSTTRTGKLKRN